MSKLDALPSKATIDTFKGVLDFYTLHLIPTDEVGIHCCRTWPTYRPGNYPESSKVMQPFFAYVNKMAPFISPDVLAAYDALAGGTGLSWKDYMVRLYLSPQEL